MTCWPRDDLLRPLLRISWHRNTRLQLLRATVLAVLDPEDNLSILKTSYNSAFPGIVISALVPPNGFSQIHVAWPSVIFKFGELELPHDDHSNNFTGTHFESSSWSARAASLLATARQSHSWGHQNEVRTSGSYMRLTSLEVHLQSCLHSIVIHRQASLMFYTCHTRLLEDIAYHYSDSKTQRFNLRCTLLRLFGSIRYNPRISWARVILISSPSKAYRVIARTSSQNPSSALDSFAERAPTTSFLFTCHGFRIANTQTLALAMLRLDDVNASVSSNDNGTER